MKRLLEKWKVGGLTLIEFIIIFTLLAGVYSAVGQGARFFRISGPATTTITSFNSDGTLVWSNALTGTNYTVQTLAVLPGGTNWADYVQLSVTNAVNTNLIFAFHPPADMAFIPASVFTMGDTLDGESDAIPVTNVFVSAFYIDTNLVSYSQWSGAYTWAAANGYAFDHAGSGKGGNHPVHTVNWYDCVKWCNARSQQAGLTPVYYTDAGLTTIYKNGDNDTVYPNWTADGYRLPTEVEWEKAARGGLSGQRFPWGNTIFQSQANYYGNTVTNYDFGPDGYNPIGSIGGTSPATSPVGSFAPNGYGLYDMAGNVGEWCWDWYGTTYLGGTDPRGPASGSKRASRGGFWGENYFCAYAVRCACRGDGGIQAPPTVAAWGLGFRCVKKL